MTAHLITFDARRHQYKLNGVQVPSVTKIISIVNKPGLATWRGAVGNAEADRISRESADFGTRVHAACEMIAKAPELWLSRPAGINEPEYAGVEPFAEVFSAWLNANVRRVLAAELRVAHSAHRYAGTIDLVAEMLDGINAVIDIKTGKRVDPIHGVQLSAYREALTEGADPIDAPRRIVLHMPSNKPGEPAAAYDCDEWASHADDWRAFLCASILYRRFG